MRPFLRTALKDLALLAALLIAGEAAIRTFYPQAARYVFTETLTAGHPIRLNSNGLRDVEFPEARPAGQRRILCLGDSVTFGAGTSVEETFPKQLEQILNARDGAGRWLVINGGGQGASITGLTEFLSEKGLAFDPEWVVLAFSPTMVSVAGRGSQAGPVKESPVRRLQRALFSLHVRLHGSYLYSLMDANLRLRLYRMGILRDRMDHPQGALFAYAFDVPGGNREQVEQAYGKVGEELASLKELLERKKILLVVAGIPSRFRISNSPCDNERGYDLSKIRTEPTERVNSICGRLGIRFVDLRPVLQGLREKMFRGELPWDDLYIPADYAHLNPRGMKIAAEQIRKALPY